MERIDFGRGQHRRVGIAFLIVYGAVATVLISLASHDALRGAMSPWAAASLIAFVVLLALTVGVLLGFYVFFGSYRFAFSEAGLRVYTWRGPRHFAWSSIQRATWSAVRGNVELVLFIGRVRRISIPLSSFGNDVLLLDEIARRLPVPVEGAERLRTRLTAPRAHL